MHKSIDNFEVKEFEKSEVLSNKSLRTQSLDNLEHGVKKYLFCFNFYKLKKKLNLTNLVKSLQEKLKKEIYLRHELNKKLKKSEKEVTNLKSYISKLEKEFKSLTKTSIIYCFYSIFNDFFSVIIT